MTSKQVLLTFWVLLATAFMLAASGCAVEQSVDSPYGRRQVFAVVPLGNESGSQGIDGARLADKLTHTLSNVGGVDALPVNRVLATMASLKMAQVTSEDEALKLLGALDADGLIVGTVSAYDPYDPPTLGMAVELYVDPRVRRQQQAVNPRKLAEASTQPMTQPNHEGSGSEGGEFRGQGPASTVSAVFDASDPRTRRALQRYARFHGQDDHKTFNQQLYRISMDLYSDFVSRQVIARLLRAETARLTPPPPADHRDDADRSTRQQSPTS